MQEETKELYTFTTTAKDGSLLEMAVVDEFEYKNKNYVAACRVENDTVLDDGCFIFRCRLQQEEAVFEKISNAIEYQEIAEAYMAMEDQ